MSRRGRAGAATVVGVAGALVAVAIVVSSRSPGTSSSALLVGVSVNWLFNDRTYSATQIDAQLTALQATGAGVARSDALWEAAEPTPPTAGVHHYDWRFDDAIARALAAHDLQWLPIIDYSAPWARSVPGRDHSPPKALADYDSYAAAFAARYGTGGSFWRTHPELPAHPIKTYEIWNEPDSPEFWSPAPDPAAYADLYLRARQAIDGVQPHARVIVGGLAHAASFITTLFGASPQLRNQVDGVAIHPYAPTPGRVLANVRSARGALDAAGLAQVPLYVTEFGWTTRPPGALDYLPERLRPGYIERTLTALGHLDCGIGAVLLYTWVTPERVPANADDWFGIAGANGGGPDVAAFERGLKAATSSGASTSRCGG